MRNFVVPSLIPIGDENQFNTTDFHVKESRFNFGVTSLIQNERVHGFLELDFLLSAQGNERVSNSFSPRIRHFYFEWRGWLIGQSWTTFMIVNLPDDLDFVGAFEGLAFNRQPQIRYSRGDWMFALENPQSTFISYGKNNIQISEQDFTPDLVIRRNFNKEKSNWSIATIFRGLNATNDQGLLKQEFAYGINIGG